MSDNGWVVVIGMALALVGVVTLGETCGAPSSTDAQRMMHECFTICEGNVQSFSLDHRSNPVCECTDVELEYD